MIVYLHDTNRPLAGVPSHLMERRISELVTSWQSTWGVACRNVEENGIVSVNINGCLPTAVFDFLASVGAVCVDLEPSDIGTLGGRDVVSLAAGDLLATDPQVQQGCSRLEIHEIMDTIAELKRLALGVSSHVAETADALIANTEPGLRAIYEHDREQDEEAAMERLRQAGLDVPQRVQLDAPPTPEPDGHNDEAYGIGPASGKVDPWAFQYEN